MLRAILLANISRAILLIPVVLLLSSSTKNAQQSPAPATTTLSDIYQDIIAPMQTDLFNLQVQVISLKKENAALKERLKKYEDAELKK